MPPFAILLIIVELFSLAVQGQPSVSTSKRADQLRPTITDADVLEMHTAGFSAQVIVAKITTSICDCDTSPASLSKLKAAGISEPVILAMIGSHAVEHNEGPPASNRMKQGQATLHFYRERAYVGSLRTMPIYIDEVQVAEVVNGRQFSMTLDSGRHVFRCRTKAEAIAVEIQPGDEYYLRVELIQGFTKNHWHIVQVAKEQGELDIKALKPLDIEDIAPLAREPKPVQER